MEALPEVGRQPQTVWMIHEGTDARQGVKGKLTLEPGRLTFTPDALGDDLVIPLEFVRKVGRAMRSAVLKVRTKSGVIPEELFFYFIEPPFWYGKQTNVTLALADTYAREQINEWIDAIRAAQKVR